MPIGLYQCLDVCLGIPGDCVFSSESLFISYLYCVRIFSVYFTFVSFALIRAIVEVNYYYPRLTLFSGTETSVRLFTPLISEVFTIGTELGVTCPE